MMRERHLLLVALAAAWCLALFLPPVLSALGGPSAGLPAYQAFARLCHQIESRSLFILGYPLAVCARCSSIYFGFLLGVMAAGMMGYRGEHFRLWLGAALLPMLLDVLLDGLGIRESTTATRVLTGVIFGGGSALLLTPLLLEAIDGLSHVLGRNRDAKT